MPTTVKNNHQVSVAQHDKNLFLLHITVGCKLVSSPSKRCQESRLLPFHNTGNPKNMAPMTTREENSVATHTVYFHSRFQNEYIISAYSPLIRIQSRGQITSPQGRLTNSLLLCSGKGKRIDKHAGIFCHSP